MNQTVKISVALGWLGFGWLGFGCLGLGCATWAGAQPLAAKVSVSTKAPIKAKAPAAESSIQMAQAGADKPAETSAKEESPESKMAKRFPQKVKVGDLIGLPMLDDGDVALGDVRSVVRSPDGKIKLIVGYSKWLGWFGRPVAVPIEVVAILARQIASVDMPPEDYAKAPTWAPGIDHPLPDNDIIRIAVTRR